MTLRYKQCKGLKCKGLFVPQEYFSINKTIDGLSYECIDCMNYRSKVKQSTFEGFLKCLFNELKHNCKKRPKDISFNIIIDDIRQLYIKQQGRCALTGNKLTHTKSTERTEADCYIINRWNISVDRIDSSKGYEKDNIQLLGTIVNWMKGDLPQNDFIDLCKLFL